MNPLQQRAALIKERFQKKQEEEAQMHTQQITTVQEQVVNLFSMDFPELYSLLTESDVVLEGDISQHGKKIILRSADKQVSIPYEGAGGSGKWHFRGKEYIAGSKESEQRLIVGLADAFSQAQPKIRS